VPVKKVRIKKNFNYAENLKSDKNQWVDLGKNHHVLIYKDADGNLKEDVVTFWKAVERKKQNQNIVQLPELDNEGEIVTTLQINDTFLLNMDENEVDWGSVNYNAVVNNLYRVQKLSSKFYEFRLVSESKIDKKGLPFYCRIQSFGEGKTGWLSFNPIKVKISTSGKLKKA